MGEETNLVYQDYGDAKGGSDSSSKLEAIRLPDLRNKRFLDLGCNSGFFCNYAKQAGAAYTLGVDNSSRIIEIARQRYPQLDFVDTGWDRFPDGEFDVAICLSAIHYAKDPVALAQNVRGCLTPGGLLILEGGLFGGRDDLYTDIRIPVWREVGDKCLHLSNGYLRHHMLRGFAISSISPSISQGGDPLHRFVIHAEPGAEVEPRPEAHKLDLVEYAAAVALSADTIVDAQPGSRYVRLLGKNLKKGLSRLFANEELSGQFVADIRESLGNHSHRLIVRWPDSISGYGEFVERAGSLGIEITASD